jgi:hypothetical protein
MRVLLDESVPRRLKRDLLEDEVATVTEMGWQGKLNGELLRLAEERFDVLIIVDQNLEYQQNLNQFDLAFILLIAVNNKYETLSPLVPMLQDALEKIQRGDFIRLER